MNELAWDFVTDIVSRNSFVDEILRLLSDAGIFDRWLASGPELKFLADGAKNLWDENAEQLDGIYTSKSRLSIEPIVDRIPTFILYIEDGIINSFDAIACWYYGAGGLGVYRMLNQVTSVGDPTRIADSIDHVRRTVQVSSIDDELKKKLLENLAYYDEAVGVLSEAYKRHLTFILQTVERVANAADEILFGDSLVKQLPNGVSNMAEYRRRKSGIENPFRPKPGGGVPPPSA
jgi:hypothetical protein